MKSKYAVSRLDNINLLIKYYESSEIDEYTMSHIAKYITVLTSGTYEDIIKNLFIEYADGQKVSREIRDYILNHIGNTFRNPDFSNLIGLINKFSKEWGEQLKSRVSDEEKAYLNNIVTNKNLIAHGDVCTISFSEIKKYFQKSLCIIENLEEIISN
ncbi:MAG: HEPN domain-containing protein [Spirochaetia bacterium]|nr:HEPN domain-containing protein [Spirochaetia bacterium]